MARRRGVCDTSERGKRITGRCSRSATPVLRLGHLMGLGNQVLLPLINRRNI